MAELVVVMPVDCVSPGGGTFPVHTLQLESNRWWACSAVVSFNRESSAKDDDEELRLFSAFIFRSPDDVVVEEGLEGSRFV